MSHKKFGPDRFSRFDVYWIQTDRQTNRHPDKPNLYIDSRLYSLYVSFFSCSVYSSFLLQADQSRFSQVYTSLICLSIYLFICLSVYLSISISHLFICFSTLYRYLFISSVFLIICFFSVSLNLT